MDAIDDECVKFMKLVLGGYFDDHPDDKWSRLSEDVKFLFYVIIDKKENGTFSSQNPLTVKSKLSNMTNDEASIVSEIVCMDPDIMNKYLEVYNSDKCSKYLTQYQDRYVDGTDSDSIDANNRDRDSVEYESVDDNKKDVLSLICDKLSDEVKEIVTNESEFNELKFSLSSTSRKLSVTIPKNMNVTGKVYIDCKKITQVWFDCKNKD